MIKNTETDILGPLERFQVVYLVTGSESEARLKGEDICLEQTVEFPQELVPEGAIRDEILGRIESLEYVRENLYRVRISFPCEGATAELPQLLNMIFGNISIKPGIQLEDFHLPESHLKSFSGPRFGVEGLRRILNVPTRPLLFTALKPMGLTNQALSDLAYLFALGGIDIIKDDHGLSNQSFSQYQERVDLCVAAVNRANEETGGNSIYMPNVTGPSLEILPRAFYAKKVGAGALMLCPGLTGWDWLKTLSENDGLNLPIISHPAFLGSYVFGDSGIKHGVLFGKIARLAGADGTIYPNFGGRFSFSREECESIAEMCHAPMGSIKPIFPCPGGGMSLESVPKSYEVYGNDVMFLVGGGLFRHSSDLVENCRFFRSMVE